MNFLPFFAIIWAEYWLSFILCGISGLARDYREINYTHVQAMLRISLTDSESGK